MAAGQTEASPPGRGLDELLADYLEQAESGRAPDRGDWIARHPEWAGELASFFANLDWGGLLADPGRPAPELIPFPAPAAPTGPAAGGERVGYLGDYELIREIGRGGMGVIYEARQASLDRVLALKLIAGGGADPEGDLRRFRREAEAIAQLDHPNIVCVHEIGWHRGRAYISMELVDGGSLAEHAGRLRDDPRASARLLADVAGAVDHAHRRGVLHRDLKPANILLGRDGVPHVADFGLARRDGPADDPTLTGSILGTPAYMAPEQAGGGRDAVTTACDVYGLGAILYELLAGRPPFRGGSALEILRQVRECEPERPRALNPKAPADLETICLRCLEKDPARRYGSAGAVADDLRRWLAGEPIAARRTSAIGRVAKWARRQPAAASLLAACLALAATAGVAAWGLHSAGRLRAEVALRDRASEQAEADGYAGRIAAAERAWAANDVAGAVRLLGSAPARLRGWDWHHLDRLCHAELHTIRGHDGFACSVAFAPGSGVLNCLDHRGGLTLWNVDAGRAVGHLRGHDGSAYGVAFDRAGTRLAAAGGDGAVRIWDVASGRLIRTLPGHGEWAAAVAFSPDGAWVASGGADRAVRVWDAATGAEVLALRGHVGAVFGVAFSPDGSRIASAGQDGSVVVWDAGSGREELRLPGHADAARCVAFRPDGARLASGGADRWVRVWDLASGREVRAFRAADARVDGLAYSPDGSTLATGGLDRSVRTWDAGTGRERASYRGHEAPVFSVAFSPDGRRLASSGQDAVIKLWDATAPPGTRALRAGQGARWAAGVGFDAGGAVLAARSDGAVLAWDGSAGPPARVGDARGRVASFAADRAGKLRGVVDGRGVLRVLTPSGEERRAFPSTASWPASVAFGPGGDRVVAGEGPPLFVTQGIRGKGVPPAAGPRLVRVWDAGSGREVLALAGHDGPVFGVAASGDGRLLASAGGDATVRVWDAATGRELWAFRGHSGPALAVAFAPDGRRLASAGADGMVRGWDASTGRPGFIAPAHSGWALAVAYSPDGMRVASGGADGLVKVRDAASGREYFALAGHEGRVQAVGFSPDGTRLASQSEDVVLLHDATPSISADRPSTAAGPSR